MLSVLLGFAALVFFILAVWLWQTAYFGWSSYTPGQPLDTLENRFAFVEAMRSGTLGRWHPYACWSGFAASLSASLTASVFALNGRADGALGFGAVSLATAASGSYYWLRRRRASHQR